MQKLKIKTQLMDLSTDQKKNKKKIGNWRTGTILNNRTTYRQKIRTK
jgi:hypothetical protein